jgi:hypothetical protein
MYFFHDNMNFQDRLKALTLNRDKTSRIHPLPQLFLEQPALVHLDLTVIGDADREPLQRARGRSLKIDPVLVETAAVAGAFVLLLALQPVRRATQVRANRPQGDTLPGGKSAGKPTLNWLGGSVRMLGNMNRAVPNDHNAAVAERAVNPMPTIVPSMNPMNPRRSSSVAPALAALGLA